MTPPFRLAIAGTRTFADYALLCQVADRLLRERAPNVVVISGSEDGADLLGQEYAAERGYKVVEYLPDIEEFGSAAEPIRNLHIARACDGAIVFWDGRCVRTGNMIRLVGRERKPVRVVRYAEK